MIPSGLINFDRLEKKIHQLYGFSFMRKIKINGFLVLFTFLLALSFLGGCGSGGSRQYANNPDRTPLESILKNYASKLDDIRVGMTATEEFHFSKDGAPEMDEYREDTVLKSKGQILLL
jgi:hypothetical protein